MHTSYAYYRARTLVVFILASMPYYAYERTVLSMHTLASRVLLLAIYAY